MYQSAPSNLNLFEFIIKVNITTKHKKRNTVLFLLGIFIVLLMVLFVGIDEIINLALKISLEIFILLILIEFAIIFLHAVRWRIILNKNVANKEVTFRNIFLATNVGLLSGNIVPAGSATSEPVRAYILSKADNFPMVKSFASSIVNLMLEILPVILLIAISIYFVITNHIPILLLIILIFAFFVVLILSLISFFSITNQKIAKKIANFFINLSSKFSFLRKRSERQRKNVDKIVYEFCESAQKNTSKEILFFGTFISLVTWFLNFLRTYIIFISLGFDIHIAIFVAVMVIVYIVSYIPTTPGGMGVWELSSVGLFSLLWVPPSISATVTLIDRFFSYWLVCLVGYISLIIISKKIW